MIWPVVLITADMFSRAIRLLPILVLVCACAARPTLPLAAEKHGLETQDIYLISQRSPDLGFNRGERTTYQKLTVTRAKKREKGDLPIAKNHINPDIHMMLAGKESFSNKSSFGSAIGRKNDVLLYVHGYNTTSDEAILRAAQIAQDYEYKGKTVAFSWPSAGQPLGYAFDTDSALFVRDGLEATIRHLAAHNNVTILAHSMGAFITLEALRQIAISKDTELLHALEGVVFISPDIDLDVFRNTAKRMMALPDPFVIISSQKDRALQLSALITGQDQRLGNLSDAEKLADLDVVLIDTTQVSGDGDLFGHFSAATSPTTIELIQSLRDIDQLTTGNIGDVSVLRVRRATQLVFNQH